MIDFQPSAMFHWRTDLIARMDLLDGDKIISVAAHTNM